MSTASRIIEMQREFTERRRLEIQRALGFQKSNPLQAAYHLGVADGHNNVVRELSLLLDTTSLNH
jgi:hypothetical protein